MLGVLGHERLEALRVGCRLLVNLGGEHERIRVRTGWRSGADELEPATVVVPDDDVPPGYGSGRRQGLAPYDLKAVLRLEHA
jgi:hypothetical protein